MGDCVGTLLGAWVRVILCFWTGVCLNSILASISLILVNTFCRGVATVYAVKSAGLAIGIGIGVYLTS